MESTDKKEPSADSLVSAAMADGFGPISAHVGPLEESFEHLGWKFAVCKAPMWSSADTASYMQSGNCGPTAVSSSRSGLEGVGPVGGVAGRRGSLEALPEAFFGRNFLRIDSPDDVELLFTAKDCLDGSKINEWSKFSAPRMTFSPSVPAAALSPVWQKKVDELKLDGQIVQSIHLSLDWTFASKYWGSVYARRHNTKSLQPQPVANEQQSAGDATSGSRRSAADSGGSSDEALATPSTSRMPLVGDVTDEDMPTEILKDQTIPILWYQQVDLYDDGLSDSGLSRADVRVRVMPSFFYVLMRQDIRVDGVMLRQVETRMFHSFGSSYILRDFQWKEATVNQLRNRGLCLEGGGENINSEKIGTQLLGEEDVKWRATTRVPLKVNGDCPQ